jgi:hypothetical protein
LVFVLLLWPSKSTVANALAVPWPSFGIKFLALQTSTISFLVQVSAILLIFGIGKKQSTSCNKMREMKDQELKNKQNG